MDGEYDYIQEAAIHVKPDQQISPGIAAEEVSSHLFEEAPSNMVIQPIHDGSSFDPSDPFGWWYDLGGVVSHDTGNEGLLDAFPQLFLSAYETTIPVPPFGECGHSSATPPPFSPTPAGDEGASPESYYPQYYHHDTTTTASSSTTSFPSALSEVGGWTTDASEGHHHPHVDTDVHPPSPPSQQQQQQHRISREGKGKRWKGLPELAGAYKRLLDFLRRNPERAVPPGLLDPFLEAKRFASEQSPEVNVEFEPVVVFGHPSPLLSQSKRLRAGGQDIAGDKKVKRQGVAAEAAGSAGKRRGKGSRDGVEASPGDATRAIMSRPTLRAAPINANVVLKDFYERRI
ncbi:hypothetical protein FRC17_006093 [Serendipita sp. 399]|nr:hypothetical protein FRC17_006093 [Serendipita sp. 399]